MRARRWPPKSPENAKALEYYGKVIAIAEGAAKDRAEVADAHSFLQKH